MRKIIVILSFCSILLFCLTGCSKQSVKDINIKLNSEISYVEDVIFKIAIKHAKGEYLEEDDLNWEWLKGDVSKINDSWASLVLDLTEVNVSNQEIMQFSNDLNGLLISVSEENEQMILEELNNLYNKIIVFKQSNLEDKNQIEKDKIKNRVLNVYMLASKGDWITAKKEIDSIIENYKMLMKDISYVEENSYNLNKIYVLLEEYRVSIQSQNYDLVRMKYINTVEEL